MMAELNLILPCLTVFDSDKAEFCVELIGCNRRSAGSLFFLGG